MKNKKKTILISLTIFIVAIAAVFAVFKYFERVRFQNTLIYYYGNECDNCNATDDLLAKNDVAKKFTLIKKEVWHDSDNGNDWQKKAEMCGLGNKPIGVPFVFINGKCYMGVGNVVDFLKTKYNL